MQTCPRTPLPLNAIASISLSYVDDGSPYDKVFERARSIPNWPRIDPSSGPLLERLPSALPPPGTLSVQLQLDRCVTDGYGSSSSVYEVSILHADSSPELQAYALPPLVAKISDPWGYESLRRDMYCYEELESVQGVVVPRCFGLFDADFIGNYTLALAEKPPQNYPPATVSGRVSVLLLERLGGHLPLKETLPEGIVEEICKMFCHISKFGIDHNDIRWENILFAPDPPAPAFPSLASPYFEGRHYAWRIIHFDVACKTNTDPVKLTMVSDEYVKALLRGLPAGILRSPNP